MSWLAAVPVMLVAVFWVLGPGLLVALASGLRGIVAWGTAPLLSVGIVSMSAVAAGELGVRWGAHVPGVASVLLAGVALGGRYLVRRWRGAPVTDPRPPDGRFAAVAATAGMVVAVVLGWISSVGGMGRPDAVSQSFDVNFHYNAVARILDTGDASSLDVGRLVSAADSAFYPSAWHGMVSLVAPYAGVPGVVTGSNMTVLAVVLVVWPLSCLLLVRQVVGRSAGAALATPVISLGFVAFPWTLVTYGALWPNLIGVSLMPAVLAMVVTFACRARHSTLGRGGAVVLAGVGLATLGLSHPNAVFGLAVVALCPMLWALAAFVRARVRRPTWTRAFTALAATGAAVAM
ncbi:MAG: DUF6541 family protein, partial [Pseudonocardia sediminis]